MSSSSTQQPCKQQRWRYLEEVPTFTRSKAGAAVSVLYAPSSILYLIAMAQHLTLFSFLL